ncbi:VWA domain-containing protein [Haloplanus salinus]|uniref:VWA domain-containing protein n=1 Tax=Haloplanus salinus TaxID=1126245 RepID=UPI0015F09FBB|nr:VWA domain-containing protein [Haloplanus salinus]
MTPGAEGEDAAADDDAAGGHDPGRGDGETGRDGPAADRPRLDPIGDTTAGGAPVAWADPDPETPDVAVFDDGTAHVGDAAAPASAPSGRYVGSRRLRSDERPTDVAVDATLRATAGRGGTAVRERDLRVKRQDGEAPTLVTFVVDSSMSMRAHGDIGTATTLATSVLRRANRENDYVAVVAFHDERADIVVPPTTDPTVAARRLDDVPVGNKTPLPAGLLAAHRLVARERTAVPDLPAVVVVVTDGRPTVGIEGDPVDETERLARRLGAADVDLVVLDLDRGTSGTDVCRSMAAAADGAYVAMADVPPTERSRVVTQVVDASRR